MKSAADKKFILNLAINGMVPTKALTPLVPVTPEQIANDLHAINAVGGITYLHLHARDEQGLPSNDWLINEKFIAAVKEVNPYLPICISCSGRIDPHFDSRSAVLDIVGDLKPDMASLTLSSLNFSQSASVNSPETIIRLAEKMQHKGIKPELEIFDLGMMNFAQYMISKGYLKPPFYFNIILGNIASAQSKLNHLGAILAELPENSVWSVGGIGNAQTPAILMALSQGGGVRTGIEDNIWFDAERTQLASNAMLVDRVHQLARLSGMNMMTPEEFRKWLK